MVSQQSQVIIHPPEIVYKTVEVDYQSDHAQNKHKSKSKNKRENIKLET